MIRLLFIVFLVSLALPPSGAEAQKNVLFIAIDDLTSSLGCYGDAVAVTPNLDQLGRKGVVFKNAYCQLPLCNPSRASVLSGRRPDEIKVYDLDRHFRDELPNVVTLPQLFQKHDYFVARVGKLYHYNVPASIGTDGFDDPPSWMMTVNPRGRDKDEEHLITNAEPHRKISAALSWLAADGKDEEQTDGMIATEAIALIEKHSQSNRPFFLGVGFFRPHTPYVAPKKYFDLYPMNRIRFPFAPPGDRDDIPTAAFAHNCPVPNYDLPKSVCLTAKQAYYATVSFIDAQIGRIMKSLEQCGIVDSTLVVVWSDHGYHLGEHEGIWQKRCLFEESARAPLIIYDPSAKGNGRACQRIVEFVDIYPTVAEACGLNADSSLPGKSLARLLENPSASWNRPAFTQVVRPGDGKKMIVGRSVRTNRWRYTDWAGGKSGRELYDHSRDPKEFENLADDVKHKQVVDRLKQMLDEKIDSNIPTTPVNPARL